MTPVKKEVRDEFLRSINALDQRLRGIGGSSFGVRKNAEKSLRYYEQGIWYEMKDRGIYLWWGWLLLIAICFNAIGLTLTTIPIFYLIFLVGRWLLLSAGTITGVYYLIAWACRWSLGRHLLRIEKHLAQRTLS